jgi:hypothetical protein
MRAFSGSMQKYRLLNENACLIACLRTGFLLILLSQIPNFQDDPSTQDMIW